MDSDPVAPGKRDPEVSPQIEEIISMLWSAISASVQALQPSRTGCALQTIEPLAPHDVMFPVKNEDLDRRPTDSSTPAGTLLRGERGHSLSLFLGVHLRRLPFSKRGKERKSGFYS